MGKVIGIINQKGGVGKTTTAASLGTGLAARGKKVLLIDADAQGSLTISLGYDEPDELEETMANVFMKVINDEDIPKGYAILHPRENLDMLPANLELSAIEMTLISVMSREYVLKTYVEQVRDDYDYIIIDCMPSLGIMTINVLACVDSVIIPSKAAYLSVKGLQMLIKTIFTVKKRLNPGIEIEGILLTIVKSSTNNAKEIAAALMEAYGSDIKIYNFVIPDSVKAEEATAHGRSILEYAPSNAVAEAYNKFIEEVIDNG